MTAELEPRSDLIKQRDAAIRTREHYKRELARLTRALQPLINHTSTDRRVRDISRVIQSALDGGKK